MTGRGLAQTSPTMDHLTIGFDTVAGLPFAEIYEASSSSHLKRRPMTEDENAQLRTIQSLTTDSGRLYPTPQAYNSEV